MNVWILCGLPHSGKTTQGKKLAQALGWTFVDTDLATEALYEVQFGRKRTCREIAKLEGIDHFRKLEKEAVRQLQFSDSAIVALGGGVLLDGESQKYIGNLGTVIYLQANPQEILLRIRRNGLHSFLDPSDPATSLARLAVEREPIYLRLLIFVWIQQGKMNNKFLISFITW